MTERILEILKAKNLSPAQFADMINVQRSSISHLISGRNKPSLEFIQKILLTFPDVNTAWLLFGKGEMTLNDPAGLQNNEIPLTGLIFPDELPIAKLSEYKKTEVEKFQKKKQSDPDGRKIEKIVYFYKDNTFKEYYPEQP